MDIHLLSSFDEEWIIHHIGGFDIHVHNVGGDFVHEATPGVQKIEWEDVVMNMNAYLVGLRRLGECSFEPDKPVWSEWNPPLIVEGRNEFKERRLLAELTIGVI